MKKAIVTGVSWSTGLGFAITKRLIADGYFVNAIYHSENACESKMTEHEKNNVRFLQADFTNRDDIKRLLDIFNDEKIDLLVNNAGAFADDDFNGPSFEENVAEWDRVMNVNLMAPYLLTRGLRDAFNDKAVIINMASTDGLKGAFCSFAYAASKAGLMNLTQSLSVLLGYDPRKIRVVAIAPGWAKTYDENDASTIMVSPSSIKIAPQITPLGRFAEPYEIANLVSFLASDQASFITGTTVLCDGGYNNVSIDLLREAGMPFEDYKGD